MALRAKPVSELTEANLRRNPVWEFDLGGEGAEGQDETWVRPVKRLPVRAMGNRCIGTPLRLANGTTVFGLLGNISLTHLRKTRQFILITFFVGNRKFFFSHADYPILRTGAAALCKFLGLSENEVFPITYDLTGLAVGLPEVVRGTVEARPPEELDDGRRMELIFEKDEDGL